MTNNAALSMPCNIFECFNMFNIVWNIFKTSWNSHKTLQCVSHLILSLSLLQTWVCVKLISVQTRTHPCAHSKYCVWQTVGKAQLACTYYQIKSYLYTAYAKFRQQTSELILFQTRCTGFLMQPWHTGSVSTGSKTDLSYSKFIARGSNKRKEEEEEGEKN